MDDFRLEDLDNFDLLSAEKVAAKYGGDKRKIGEAAKMGLVNPTVAVMAGMFIDRMRSAAIQEQQPSTTVAQDVMAPAPAAQMAGLGATPQAQAAPQMPAQAPTQMAAAPAMPSQTATLAEGGLAALPVNEDMFPDEYAGGGIVAFQSGGTTIPFDELSPVGRDAVVPGNTMSSFFSGLVPDQRRIDPETGDAVSLGEYMRRVDERRASLAGKQLLSPTPTSTTGTDSIETLRAKAAASRASLTPQNRALYDENISGIKRIAEDVAPKGKQTESKATEGVNVKAADKALTDYAKKVKEINKEFGVSDEPDAKARAALEKYKEKLNKDLDKAGALGLIQAGLGIAGGKSQYALQNLAGATPAIEQYGKAMSQIRESEKGILDSEAKLDQAADARARGNVKLALELEKDAKELAARERQAAAAEKQANRQSSEEIRMNFFRNDPEGFKRYMESQRSGFETAEISRIKTALSALDNRILFEKPGPEKDKLLQERQRLFAMLVPKPAATATGTVDANNPLLKGG